MLFEFTEFDRSVFILLHYMVHAVTQKWKAANHEMVQAKFACPAVSPAARRRQWPGPGPRAVAICAGHQCGSCGSEIKTRLLILLQHFRVIIVLNHRLRGPLKYPKIRITRLEFRLKWVLHCIAELGLSMTRLPPGRVTFRWHSRRRPLGPTRKVSQSRWY